MQLLYYILYCHYYYYNLNIFHTTITTLVPIYCRNGCMHFSTPIDIYSMFLLQNLRHISNHLLSTIWHFQWYFYKHWLKKEIGFSCKKLIFIHTNSVFKRYRSTTRIDKDSLFSQVTSKWSNTLSQAAAYTLVCKSSS